MRRIAAVLVVLAMMVGTGNVWGQEANYRQLQDAGVKEVSVKFNHFVSTEWASPDDDFIAVLDKAVLDSNGHVIALDGAKVYGFVLETSNWDSNWDDQSRLGLVVTSIEGKNGELILATSEPLYLTAKRPTKKSVLMRSIGGAVLGGLLGFFGGLDGEYGAVAGASFLSGAVLANQLDNRNSYQPAPVEVGAGRVLRFNLVK